MCREIVDNVLSGTKAGFKAILSFEHSIERKKMDNQKSKSTFSATLQALILGTFVLGLIPAGAWIKKLFALLGGLTVADVVSAAKLRFTSWRGNRSQDPQPIKVIMGSMKKLVASTVWLNPAGFWSAAKMQSLLLTLIVSIFAFGGSLTAALAAEMVWDRTIRKMVEAPRYGGTLTFANNNEPANADPSIAGAEAGFAVSGVLEKLSIAVGHRPECE